MMKLAVTFLFSLGLMGCATSEPVYGPEADSKPDQPSQPIATLVLKLTKSGPFNLTTVRSTILQGHNPTSGLTALPPL